MTDSWKRVVFALTVALVLVSGARADDWPHWLGAERDGVYREQGVVTQIPDEGLPVRWRAEAAYGYAGPAVADGKVYVFDYVLSEGTVTNQPGTRDKLTGKERLRALDAESGKVLWTHEYDRQYEISYGGGPRCTPAVDVEHVFTLGAEGDLSCVRVADGAKVWSVNFKERFGSPTPIWGHSAHPLVVGDTVYCVAGGEGSVAVALDEATGATLWKNLSATEQGYCPPIMIHHDGADELLIWHADSLNGLNPKSGEALWSMPARPSYGMAVHAPIVAGDRVFISAIGDLSVMLRLVDGPDVDVAWAGNAERSIESVNTTPIVDGGVIYGVDRNTSELVALDAGDGKKLWGTREPTNRQQRERHGTVFLVKHEPSGGFYLFNDDGELITARLSAEGYEETGRFKVLEPTGDCFGRPVVWSHPAFAGRTLYARNDKELVAVSLEE